MINLRRVIWCCCLGACLWAWPARAQIDPVKRDLVQLGYNGAFQGHSPLAAYAFYYRNQPGFLRTNLTLRLAIAPTYLDSELGIAGALGPQTDLGLGVAGGGFADSYTEIRQGKYLPGESFTGHGGEASVSLYHLFNPQDRIPLNGLVRGTAHFSTYDRDDDTSPRFKLPEDRGAFSVRTGLRGGGREPVLFPSLAMELSVWYEGFFRTEDGSYGFADRSVEACSHLFWAEALLIYTLPEIKHTFHISLTAGTSADADRFSAYRLGAFLPMVSEYPLSLPGYYYQEISATDFALLGANYLVPLDKDQRWNISATAATAWVDYLDGLGQPGHWHAGVGGGLLYSSASWKVVLGYSHGFEAIRSHGRGADSIGLLMQLDLEHAASHIRPAQPRLWRGFQRMLGAFGS